MQVFTPMQGVGLLTLYAIITTLVVYAFTRGFTFTKGRFLVAERNVNTFQAGFTIAAMWIWAPALFVSAQKAFTQGWVGFFWFWVPNTLCLILFGFFAWKLRRRYPNGWTLSGYMQERYSRRVQNVYFVALVGLATCSFAVQLLAGAGIISNLSGLPFFWVTVMLSLIPIAYSLHSGMKASVISNTFQMVVMLIALAIIVPWAIYEGGGMTTVIQGLYGKTGTYSDLFTGDGLNVFLTFGIPVTIGLLAGPFGDQSFWQVAFSVRRDSVWKAFCFAAFVFALVPLSMSLLGFLGAGMGNALQLANPNDTSYVNLEVVMRLLPWVMLIPFTYLLLSGLVTTLDSNLAAMSSLAGHDILDRRSKHAEIGRVKTYSRGSMLVLVVGGVAIANFVDQMTIGDIVGKKILYLFLFYGTLRASTLLPTIITLVKRDVSEAGMFWGPIVSLVIGLPIFAYGNLYGITSMIVGGSLFSVFASGTIVLIATWLEKSKTATATV